MWEAPGIKLRVYAYKISTFFFYKTSTLITETSPGHTQISIRSLILGKTLGCDIAMIRTSPSTLIPSLMVTLRIKNRLYFHDQELETTCPTNDRYLFIFFNVWHPTTGIILEGPGRHLVEMAGIISAM